MLDKGNPPEQMVMALITQSSFLTHKGKDLCSFWHGPVFAWNSGTCQCSANWFAWELLFLVEKERGKYIQASDGDREEEMVLVPYLVSWTMANGMRGKSKEAATMKGSVSAVHMEMCDKDLGSGSLPYLDWQLKVRIPLA